MFHAPRGHILSFFASKQWDPSLISISIGIIILSLQTLEFLSYPSKHWNSTPVFINIRILILPFETLDAFRLVFITFIALNFLFIVFCVCRC